MSAVMTGSRRCAAVPHDPAPSATIRPSIAPSKSSGSAEATPCHNRSPSASRIEGTPGACCPTSLSSDSRSRRHPSGNRGITGNCHVRCSQGNRQRRVCQYHEHPGEKPRTRQGHKRSVDSSLECLRIGISRDRMFDLDSEWAPAGALQLSRPEWASCFETDSPCPSGRVNTSDVIRILFQTQQSH